MSWYSKVSKDISHLPDCIEHFYSQLEQARTEVKVYGNLEKASSLLPGIVEQRFNQLQEIEGVLEYLKICRRRSRCCRSRKNCQRVRTAKKSVAGNCQGTGYQTMATE
jgi:hypothetical protein